MIPNQAENLALAGTVTAIFAAAIIVGKGCRMLTRNTMSRKFDRQVDKSVADRLK